MKASHTFIDHTADVLFEAQAESLEDLFRECALAVSETQVELKTVTAREMVEITAENTKIENLLFDFLGDLLFYKDSRQLLLCKFEITITQKNDNYSLICLAYGEKINQKKHKLGVDVKAITMHLFEVRKEDEGWYAKVLVDI